MTSTTANTARTTPWTEDDLSEDMQTELLEGTLLVNALPSVTHQRIVRRLQAMIEPSLPKEFVLLDAGVRVAPDTVFIPDVIAVRLEGNENRTTAVFDPADVFLVAEVASPSSRTIDLTVKPTLYAQAGIPWYWEIDEERVLTVHKLMAGPGGISTYAADHQEYIDL